MSELEPVLIERLKLQGSLLEFTRIFYYLVTGRKFLVSSPVGRESHHLIIMRELVKVSRLETNRLLINVPPGHGKSTIITYFIAWTMSIYPDSNFLYISYSQELAAKHTANIKQIMETPLYKKLFGVELRRDSSAKDCFRTIQGGTVMAFGSSGSITGQDAGLPELDRFSGGVFIDDAHKPDEVHSDYMLNGVWNNYNQTIKPRPRGINVPIVGIGQRLHEDDLWARLIRGEDGYNWKHVILKAIDDAGNILHPTVHPREMLLIEQENNPYVFSAQYQQDPQPAGGGIFKPEWLVLADEQPEITTTFIVVDCAETDKEYNDATVFSFFGLHKIWHGQVETDLLGLHWIDCVELRVEPKDLEHEYMQFYADCMRFHVKPNLAAIEKKSTGTTLASVLKKYQGMKILEVDRSRASGSKTARFLQAQPYVAAKQISLPRNGRHTQMCLEHMKKITANNTHRFDDIADTLADGIRLALIDKIFSSRLNNPEADSVSKALADKLRRQQNLRGRVSW